ncbi:MAG: NAD+ synthase, partial [Candidatus Komeilibacteria bacterium]|nr:NAD+ synthase [Candidatus Komeilibacteria bacterium]
MKIGILQLNLVIGDWDNNAQKILNGYRQACQQGAELVVTSELAISGYPPRDQLERESFLEAEEAQLQTVMDSIGDIPLII